MFIKRTKWPGRIAATVAVICLYTLFSKEGWDAPLHGRNGGYRFLPAHLLKHFPSPNSERKDYHEWNTRTLQELHTCLALDNCGPNQRKVALLAAHWFEEGVVRGFRGGNGVWSVSVYKHLRELGYTTLFATSFEEALKLYRMMPDLVKVVIRNKAGECHTDPRCVKGPDNPTGIPAWKIFDFEYFPSPHAGHYHASLMRGKWILSANPDPKSPSPIQYIGFSIEDDCTAMSPIPLSERPNRVWMLMKELTYAYDFKFAWNRTYFSRASSEVGMDFVGAWNVDQHFQWKPEKQGLMKDIEDRHGVINLISKEHGRKSMSPGEWEREIRKSRVMIGVGNPWWSPSPYHALCLGVPFLNPIFQWDQDDPWNKDKWETQHGSMQKYDPPYVYHVHKNNYTGFVEAIRTASQTEISAFIPEFLTEKSVRHRVQTLMETDWKAEAVALLEQRMKEKERGKKPYIFEI